MSTLDILSEDEQAIVRTDVRPVVRELEHTDTYPEALIGQMKDLGIFGLAVPEEYGGAPVSTPCYVLVAEELARGWMSLAGAMALTEPGGGSGLQAMRTVARKDDEGYVVNGTKTWITNSRRSELIALLCKTDPQASPAHRGISILLVEHGPGLTVSRDLPKLGYEGVESCELSFENHRAPVDAVLGGVEGEGFAQMMKGLETGRLQVAARALGVGRAARWRTRSPTRGNASRFGKPIWKHQSIGNYLADMATSLTAARQLTLYAAREADAGRRVDTFRKRGARPARKEPGSRGGRAAPRRPRSPRHAASCRAAPRR
ncbi:acyl-CoA dehydrogenase family protein [Streptomyces sp. NPDC021098]|uniref:acyl-CoA dehydrogenase family protein n=1 Tax=unclassified Streptomyces TaxID=2593676 RepID=UPI003796D0B9